MAASPQKEKLAVIASSYRYPTFFRLLILDNSQKYYLCIVNYFLNITTKLKNYGKEI